MWLNTLLAAGLLASTASQLRADGGAIGPGEALLAVWLLAMLVREAGRLGPPLTPALSRLLAFWIAFTLALCLGTTTGYAIKDVHDPTWFLHDILAYLLAAAVSCLSIVAWERDRSTRQIAWLVAALGAIWLALQVAYGWGLISTAGVDPWEWDRLRGVCESSNQLALLCVVIGFVSLHLVEVEQRAGMKLWALCCAGMAGFAGHLTKSDAFTLVLVAAVPTFGGLKFARWLLRTGNRLSLRSASAWIVVLVVPAAAAYAVPLRASVETWAIDLARGMTRDPTSETEEHARLRMELWGEAIRRGVEARMLGLGPGPHLEIPDEIVVGRRDDSAEGPTKTYHPELGAAPNFEAHNTLLDLFTQGGVLAVGAFGWIYAMTLGLTVGARLHALATLVFSLLMFSFFHLIVRHPIFWFAITFSLVAAAGSPDAFNARTPSIRRSPPDAAWRPVTQSSAANRRG